MQSIRVWDNFTRLYHISQLILLGLLWYSGDNADFELHFQCGFALAGLWITRIIWGFCGSDTSRFGHFIKSPWRVLKAWRSNLIVQPHQGHNPVGGYMVLALLGTLFLQIITGLFATDDVLAEGPLYAFVSESTVEFMDSLHASNFDILLILVAIHALAGILHLIRGDNVIKAIITGKKNVPVKHAVTEHNFKSALLPTIIWLFVAAMLYYLGMSYASY
ncbi:hydrogenase [Thalassotalea sp. HSM 43]|uniref:cytochrome b/b6 domain-containing protein n=1 Tax=Thalassotalea sp. HSM 43 TaxID=2552945 RepID=UPI0010810AA4|nr:cytochrome b/b6 domain-containing protein [Thalassotalea sp. HSM 43]QBY04753.1 hydrogenase [Thalassotalea sp. HSM 43]